MFINKRGKQCCTADEFLIARCISTRSFDGTTISFACRQIDFVTQIKKWKSSVWSVNAPCNRRKFISRATVFTPFVYKHLQDAAHLWEAAGPPTDRRPTDHVQCQWGEPSGPNALHFVWKGNRKACLIHMGIFFDNPSPLMYRDWVPNYFRTLVKRVEEAYACLPDCLEKYILSFQFAWAPWMAQSNNGTQAAAAGVKS